MNLTRKDNQKVAWITGGGTGIGAELTKILVKNNWLVVISGRRIKKLKALEKINDNIKSFVLDITSLKDCQSIVNQINNIYKRLDLVILNAAAYNPGHLNFSNISEINKVIDTNLSGQINCISCILPEMKKRKSGQIVLVSSPAGFRGLPNAGIYGVTKSALTFLAESMYLELMQSNIKIQVVHPGFIKTPMTDKNDFPMPFLMSAKNAAERIFTKLGSNNFEIYFPKRLILPMKFLKILPNKIYFSIMKKLLRNKF